MVSRRLVIETSRPIARVAKELGINEGTLGNWVGIYRRKHAGEEPPLTVTERARLRELERETRGTEDGERVPSGGLEWFPLAGQARGGGSREAPVPYRA